MQDTLGVTDFLEQARRLLEASYPYVWIEGEVSTLRRPGSGHIYFTLKDDKSQVRCAFFRNAQSSRGYQPIDGDLVRIKARVTVYSARGDLQLIVQQVEEAGEGLLMRRFEELKKRLAAEGLFETDRKKALPRFPRTVGIISSPTGAALHDIITTMERRFPSIRLVIYPSVVQGDTAPALLRAALADAIRHMQVDILVIARGGGSLEDLWGFNDEALARDIAACPIPVVSAIGHEIDFTICDFVADRRAPTPTAAGELVSPDGKTLIDSVEGLCKRMPVAFQRKLQSLTQSTDWLQRQLVHPNNRIRANRERLEGLAERQIRTIAFLTQQWQNRLSGTISRFKTNQPCRALNNRRRQLRVCGARAHRAIASGSQLSRTRQSALAHRLDTISPLATLGRGYSIATLPATGKIVREVSGVSAGEGMDVRVLDGTIHCKVSGETKIER